MLFPSTSSWSLLNNPLIPAGPPRRADWALTHTAYGVVTGELVHGGAVSRPHREMLGLRPGSLCAELSGNDTAVQSRAFINRFARACLVNYPARPRLPGWVYAHDGDWWPRLIGFVEKRFEN